MNRLHGELSMKDKKISFQLDYSIQKNNLLVGTTLTAAGTPDETRCKIKGKYNRKTGDFYFYETVVISSKATFENLNFCLLTAELKKKETQSTVVYAGKFTGYIRGSKRKCAAGEIKLSRPKPKRKVAKKPSVRLPKKTIYDTLYSNVNSKKSVSYFYQKNNLTLEIWDDANVDGDKIKLLLNGKEILSQYELRKKKKKVLLNLSNQKKHYLKIIALNEGKGSPNTSRIRINLGTNTKELTAHVKKNDFVFIQLLKQQ